MRRIFQFGKFQIDALARTLRREETIVKLNSRAFDVLLYLVQNPGKLLTRDELLKNVWQDAFVDESSLPQTVSLLRRALEEKPGDNSYIVTLPGRGYQFVSAVRVVAPEVDPSGSDHLPSEVAISDESNSGGLILQKHTLETSVITSTEERERRSAPVSRGRLLVRAAAPVAVLTLLAGGYFYSHRGPKLTEKDTIVFSDFSNSTGDAIFDDTLKTGLDVSLRQSPFLNVLSDSEAAKTLQLMTLPANTRLTPEVVGELCQRAGSKAYIAGSIGSLGSKYVVGLKAVNCQNGDTLAEEQVTAASKEKVLDALGEAATKLRGELGESLASVQKFDVPLEQATTSSLEALKAYSLGMKARSQKGPAAALPYFQRAVEVDSNFAMGYMKVGSQYASLSELGRASPYLTKAFQLREHASEREKLAIAAIYYMNVTGELDKAAQTYQEEVESYPREGDAYAHLGFLFCKLGQFGKGAEATREAVVLVPRDVTWHENLAGQAFALQHFDEARQILHDVQARKLDDFAIHEILYFLAFLSSDLKAMAAEQQWFAAKPEYQGWGLAFASDTEAYGGRLAKARGLTREAVDAAVRTENKENGALWQANVALEHAAYGNPAEARQAAAQALKLFPASQGVEIEAALTFAIAGDTARAESLAQDLGKRFPLDTQMQALWLPAIHAQLALNKKKTPSALDALQAAPPIEFGNIVFANTVSCLYPTYIRGEVYLAAGQGSAAAAEFQKILDHGGIVVNCWPGALAHLGVARANALQARTSQGADAEAARVRALAAYKDFLTLWKDADPDIPILKEAKNEYAKLQLQRGDHARPVRTTIVN